MSQNETIKVCVRVRPVSQAERDQFPQLDQVQVHGNEIRITSKQISSKPGTPTSPRGDSALHSRTTRPWGSPKSFNGSPGSSAASSPSALMTGRTPSQQNCIASSYKFEEVFGPECDSQEVYDRSGCQQIVSSVCEGCNGTIFVYGQTGAGKTYTIDDLSYLAIRDLLAHLQSMPDAQYALYVSVVELYNESLRDLISGNENLVLRMSKLGQTIEGLTEQICTKEEQVLDLVRTAKSNRVTGETKANARSSRSHLIVRIKLEAIETGSSGTTKALASLLNLVDLAGSERVDKAGSSETSTRFKEATHINKGLLVLGNVVTALGDAADGRKAHIPYRDSKLTRLLQDSLGGSARTALIACITPLPEWHLEQSRHTLDFAARAGRVVCTPQANVMALQASDASAEMELLQAEVTRLRDLVEAQQRENEVLKKAQAISSVSSRVDGTKSGGGIWRILSGGRRLSRETQSQHPAQQHPPHPSQQLQQQHLGVVKQGSLLKRLTSGKQGTDSVGSEQGTDSVGVKQGAWHDCAPPTADLIEANWVSEDDNEVRLAASGMLSTVRTDASTRSSTTAVKDAIIKELVALVNNKKGEAAGLREQLRAAQAQLASIMAERAAHEDRVRILADKINLLNLQRQKEFQKWQGHLSDVEDSLLRAQQEASGYRLEMEDQQRQLAALQHRRDQQESELAALRAQLQEQEVLLSPDGPINSPAAFLLLAQQCARQVGALQDSMGQLLPVSSRQQQGPAVPGGGPGAAAEAAGGPRRHAVMSVAVGRQVMGPGEAQALEQLMRDFHAVVGRLGQAAEQAQSAAATPTTGQQQQQGEQVPQLQGGMRRPAGSMAGTVEVLPDTPSSIASPTAAAAAAAARCTKCDNQRTLMAFMAKLKDEVTGLRQQLKQRDVELAAATETATTLRADLQEASARVLEQQERLESLQDQLELAQHRTPQAQLISMHMAGPSRSISHLTDLLTLNTQQGTRALALAPAGSGMPAHEGPGTPGSATAAAAALDELQQQLVVMWQQLNVSWLHRTQFIEAKAPWTLLAAGSGTGAASSASHTGSSSFTSAAGAGCCSSWEERPQCLAELQRLQAVQARLLADAASGAVLCAMQERRVVYEKRVLLQCMEGMPRRQLHALLQEWGIQLSSTNKKEQLLQLLWQQQTAAAAALSAATCKAVLGAACEPRVLGLLLDLSRPPMMDLAAVADAAP